MLRHLIFFLFIGCSDDKDDLSTYQTGSGDNSSSEPNTTGGTQLECGDTWEEVDGVWIDPVLCTAWSSKTSSISWHEAISPAEAEGGGCTQFCDQDTVNNYCKDLEEGGYGSWKVPDLETLQDLSTRQPPFDDLQGDLWSSTSDSADELAWSVNLSQPGAPWALGKSDPADLRCILD